MQWRKLREKMRATRAAKAAAVAAASERRALAEHEDVVDPESPAASPAPAVSMPAASSAGGGGRRGKRRFTGAKKDPASIRGAARFIEKGVRLICSECDTEEASEWRISKVNPDRPVCKTCYYRQVRRASHSLASIVRNLSALSVFVTDSYITILHRLPPQKATAPTAGSPVRIQATCARRG